MQFQFYSVLAVPSLLTLEARVMSFEHCVHNGQVPVRRALLSDDSSCSIFLRVTILHTYKEK